VGRQETEDRRPETEHWGEIIGRRLTIGTGPDSYKLTRISENMLTEKPLAELFTLESRLISMNKLLQTETNYSTHDFKPGVYLLRIRMAGEICHTRMIVGK
jgi:hypothetical protein